MSSTLPDDRIRLQHMVEAAQAVQQMIANRSRGDLDTDLMLRLAVVRAIEILGEAASRISAPTRAATSAIPWTAIVAMRNRLSHAYFDVDYDVVWRTATVEIPAVLPSLQEALERGRSGGAGEP
jgi:uncharacterized protein with HEPN domain